MTDRIPSDTTASSPLPSSFADVTVADGDELGEGSGDE